MNTFAAFFASGVAITFTAATIILAEAYAHRYAVNNGEYLETVIPVVDVSISEAA